jgi:hypothetical protein
VLLVATLAERLGLGAADRRLRASGQARGALSAVAQSDESGLRDLGAQSIDGCDVLRSGRTGRPLGVRVMAPSTLGTFLRAFTFGHVRQLDGAPLTTLSQGAK